MLASGLLLPQAIFRGEQRTKGAFARANEGGEEAAGWWPTSPGSRSGGRPTTPASWPPTTNSTCPATASPQAGGTAPALDGRDLYRHRLAADAIYRASYRRQLSRTLDRDQDLPERTVAEVFERLACPVCGRNAIGQLGVANGTRGTVIGLDPEAHTLTIRVEGREPQKVVLPGWYLDGRGCGERNRRVDLAYATTGHRAQGLTKWRARLRFRPAA
jgi:hypothetical protein